MWEQLVYTSTDEVVDGSLISGWHVKEHSPGLTAEQAELLLTFVRQVLDPIRPLDRFPTREEIDEADRRFSQFSTPWGPALVHTSAAGRDATQRPNTVTHIVLDTSGDLTPNGHLADFWRADWWLVPYDQEAVRQATLPAPREIGPGSAIGIGSVISFLEGEGRLNALGALVDAVNANTSAREAGAARVTAVMPIKSSDEAALWIAALSRLTSPAKSRELTWSTLERIQSPIDLQNVLARGLDIAFVPEVDLAEKRFAEPDLVVLHPLLTHPVAPKTAWGVLAAGALSSTEVFVDVTAALDDVLQELDDQSGTTLAWPLAMTEACDRGLLDPPNRSVTVPVESVTKVVDRELLTCESSAWERSEYLSEVVGSQFGSDIWTADQWHDVLAPLEEVGSPNQLLKSVAGRYIHAATLDSDWLTSERPVPKGVATCVAAWSAEAPDPELATLLDQAHQKLLTARPRWTSEKALIISTECLLTYGLRIPEIHWDHVLQAAIINAAEQVRLHSAVTLQTNSSAMHQQVLSAVETQLRWAHKDTSDDSPVSFPTGLSKSDLHWLGDRGHLEDTPVIDAAIRLENWRRAPTSQSKRALLDCLTRVPFRFGFDQLIIEKLAPRLSPGDFGSLDKLEREDVNALKVEYLLTHQDTLNAREIAQDMVDMSKKRSRRARVMSEELALAHVLSVLRVFTMSSQDQSLPTDHDSLRVAVSTLLDSSLLPRLTNELRIECATLALRISALDLLAVAAGRSQDLPQIAAEKEQLDRLIAGEAAAMQMLYVPDEKGLHTDLATAARITFVIDTFDEPTTRLLTEAERSVVARLAKEKERADSPFHQADKALKNILRARFGIASEREKTKLWEELARGLPDEEGREWLEKTLSFAPKRRLRRIWDPLMRKER